MSKANAKQPTTEVQFAATPAFARAFGEDEAKKQQAKFDANPLLPRDKDKDDDMFVMLAFIAGVLCGVAMGVGIGVHVAH